MKFYSTVIFSFAIVAFTSCGNKTETGETHAETGEHHQEGNSVLLTEAQMKATGVQLDTIEMKNLTTSISVTGVLEVPNQNKALVTSLAGGVLHGLNVHPGDHVRKGQLIGTVSNMELSGIQQQLVTINTQISFSEKEVKRQKELVEGNAAPLKNLQKVEADLDGLTAQRNALKAQLTTIGAKPNQASAILSVTAPISGTISEITAQIGSQVNANTPIAQITNNSELHLDLFVYEKDLSKVTEGQTIHFSLTNSPGKEYDAVIYSVGTAFVNETKAIPVHAKVVNDKTGLIEGMSITARISLGKDMYQAVPDEAIVSASGNDYIFILSDKKPESHHEESNDSEEGRVFERVQIVKGTSDVGYTEIKPVIVLSPGTKVVTKGAFFLMAKMTNTGEHEH